MRVAAVDIGSNTLLCLVAQRQDDGEVRAVRDECRFGRLARGLDQSGRLDPDAVKRSLDFLREFRTLLDQVGVDAIAAAGTEALRKADNASDFLEPAREILGVPVEVITGDREAELVQRAVDRSFPELAPSAHVIADVGGGSTEILVVESGAVRSKKSVPIGAVRHSERHLKSDPPSKAEAQALIEDVDGALSKLALPTALPLVGTSGTATTLASVELKLRDFDPERVHGLKLAPGSIERQLARYLEVTLAERKRMAGMVPERADVITAGCAIYARLLHRLEAPEMIVSDRGVRWGLAYELLGAVSNR